MFSRELVPFLHELLKVQLWKITTTITEPDPLHRKDHHSWISQTGFQGKFFFYVIQEEKQATTIIISDYLHYPTYNHQPWTGVPIDWEGELHSWALLVLDTHLWCCCDSVLHIVMSCILSLIECHWIGFSGVSPIVLGRVCGVTGYRCYCNFMQTSTILSIRRRRVFRS